MAYHDDLFPVGVTWGTSGGPGHNTDIIETDSGSEQRVQRWNGARHMYNAAEQVKSYGDLATIKTFLMAREGAVHSFPYKDWTDYTSASTHIGTPANTDQVIGTGDGTTQDFQIVKRYTSGVSTIVRNISKPISGSVTVAFDGVNQAAGWSVNLSTGVITFTVAPTIGVVITAGFQFYVPVRFGKEADDILNINMDNYGSGSIPDIPLVEDLDGLNTNDDFPYGGAATTDPLSTDVTLVENNGRLQSFNPSADGFKVKLPATTDLPGGGAYFYLVNLSLTHTFIVANADGTTLATVAVAPGAGLVTVVFALLNDVDGVWYVG